MELRRAERKDAAAISRVHAASWKSGYRGMIDQGYLDGLREDHWVLPMSQWLESGSLEAVIAWEDGEAAGCVAYGQFTPPTGASGESAPPQGYGYILSLYVHPRYFRRGYGRALLGAAEDALRAKGHAGSFLYVLDTNAGARRFYERCGYVWDGSALDCGVGGQRLTDMRYLKAF